MSENQWSNASGGYRYVWDERLWSVVDVDSGNVHRDVAIDPASDQRWSVSPAFFRATIDRFVAGIGEAELPLVDVLYESGREEILLAPQRHVQIAIPDSGVTAEHVSAFAALIEENPDLDIRFLEIPR